MSRHASYHAALIRHEAGHACAALLSGLRVRAVAAPPLPAALPDDLSQAAGVTEVERKGDRRARAITLLAGPLAEGLPAPSWPVVPDSSDEQQLAPLVNETDELTYAEIVRDTEALLASGEFTRMHRLVSELLSHPPHRLDGQQLEGIKSVTATTKGPATPTYGRTVFPAEIRFKSVHEPDEPNRHGRRALDGLGEDLFKALISLPVIQIAEFDG